MNGLYTSLGSCESKTTPKSFSWLNWNCMFWCCKRLKSENGCHIVVIPSRSRVFWSVLRGRASLFPHFLIRRVNSCKVQVSKLCISGIRPMDFRLALKNCRINGCWDITNCCECKMLCTELMAGQITLRSWYDRWSWSTRKLSTVFGLYTLGPSWLLWHHLTKTRYPYP